LDFVKLRHFVHVADNGSFTRAAGTLAVAQSALSRQIRELEEELGIALLHRNGRGVSLTEAGTVFLPRARSLIKDADDLINEMRSIRDLVGGRVTLGVPPSVSHILLTPLLAVIARDYPDIQMRIVEGFSGHIYEWLLNGRVDLAVLYNARTSPVLTTDRLLVEDMCLVARSGDPLTQAGSIALAEVSPLPLVLPGRPHGLRLLVDDAFAEQGLSLRLPVEVDALATIKRLVADGTHYTILPSSALMQELQAGVLSVARIVGPVISRELLLASSTHRPRNRALRTVAQIARKLITDMARSYHWAHPSSIDEK
jgi:LysR family nitrogen assimilation transcriptional regulator